MMFLIAQQGKNVHRGWDVSYSAAGKNVHRGWDDPSPPQPFWMPHWYPRSVFTLRNSQLFRGKQPYPLRSVLSWSPQVLIPRRFLSSWTDHTICQTQTWTSVSVSLSGSLSLSLTHTHTHTHTHTRTHTHAHTHTHARTHTQYLSIYLQRVVTKKETKTKAVFDLSEKCGFTDCQAWMPYTLCVHGPNMVVPGARCPQPSSRLSSPSKSFFPWDISQSFSKPPHFRVQVSLVNFLLNNPKSSVK